MHRFLILLPVLLLLCQCTNNYDRISYANAPKIINVSAYDPKEKQRSGKSYTPLNQSALRENGAQGLIARCGKGGVLDAKCADFLTGAEHQAFLLGSYYFLTPNVEPRSQARQYISRLREIKTSRCLRTPRILLVADIDTNCHPHQMISFIDEIEKLTGTTPVVYLENSNTIRARLRAATPDQKQRLRRSPYWLALYSNKYTGLESPQALANATGIWTDWCMWQYGGVWWQGGRSQIHHYSAGDWRTPAYFGNLDCPLERSGFNGSTADLHSFWNRHSWQW